MTVGGDVWCRSVESISLNFLYCESSFHGSVGSIGRLESAVSILMSLERMELFLIFLRHLSSALTMNCWLSLSIASIFSLTICLTGLDSCATPRRSTSRCKRSLFSKRSLYFSEAWGMLVLSFLADAQTILVSVAPISDVVLKYTTKNLWSPTP